MKVSNKQLVPHGLNLSFFKEGDEEEYEVEEILESGTLNDFEKVRLKTVSEMLKDLGFATYSNSSPKRVLALTLNTGEHVRYYWGRNKEGLQCVLSVNTVYMFTAHSKHHHKGVPAGVTLMGYKSRPKVWVTS